MTPDEMLNDLRDIQLPEATTALSGAGYSLFPFVLLAIALLAVFVTRIFRSRSWLREARRRLDEIDRENPQDARALLDLAGKIGRYRQVTPLPPVAFLPPHSIAPDEVTLLYKHLRNIIEK